MIDNEKIDRLAEIKKQQEKLKAEADRLEGEIILECRDELENTKYKTLSQHTASGATLAVTLAENLKITYPSLLKSIFGEAYNDLVKTETKYTVTAAGKRILTGIWTGKYIRQSLDEAIKQLPVDEKTQQKLAKKLKGVKFDTDKKNLINIGNMSEQDASEYAYLISEAAIWQQFETILKLNNISGKEATDRIINLIDTAVIVDETPKVSVETMRNA